METSEPKRNSGRTGRRRLTAAEAALRGGGALRDHIRRYEGSDARATLPPLPEPPEWFTSPLSAIWTATAHAAPPGLLTAADFDNLCAYCLAVDVHRRLAQEAAACKGSLSAQLERRLRLAGGELGRASKALGLTPYDRARIGVLPVAGAAEPISEHMRWDTILPDGTRIPYQLKRS